MALAAPARSQAVLYFNTDPTARVNLDGSSVDWDFFSLQSSGLSPTRGMVSHRGYLYWADREVGLIGRARVDGTEVNPHFLTVPDDERPHDVAVNDAGIYWLTAPRHGGRIGRADLDGTNADPNFINTFPGHLIDMNLTATNSHIYWTGERNSFPQAYTIGRANTDGSAVDPELITFGYDYYSPRPGDLKASSSHLYWAVVPTGGAGNGVGRATLDGTDVNNSLIQVEPAVNHIAIGGGYLFFPFINEEVGEYFVGRANLDGSGLDMGFLKVPETAISGGPQDIAADDLVIPNTQITKKPKKTTSKRKARFAFKSPNAPDASFQCALDKGRFRPCSSPKKVRVGRGSHRFYVRAVNATGPDPSPARAKWKVSER